jgi:hypothetical protein
MQAKKNKIISEYARMWPREVFDIIEEGKLKIRKDANLDKEENAILKKNGVYVLYRDEHPYYIGKAKDRTLFQRLHDHANKSTDKYFNLWNYFSAFVVDTKHIDEIEGILIAVMQTANSAAPKIKQVKIPAEVRKLLRKARQSKFNFV